MLDFSVELQACCFVDLSRSGYGSCLPSLADFHGQSMLKLSHLATNYWLHSLLYLFSLLKWSNFYIPFGLCWISLLNYKRAVLSISLEAVTEVVSRH